MKSNFYRKKRYYLLFTLYFLGFGVAVAFLTSSINYRSNITDIEKNLAKMANSEAAFKRELLKNEMSRVEMLLASITKNELTLKYIRTGHGSDKKNLINLFYALSFSSKDIMQLRYIDASGKEVIRIDREKNTPELVIIPERNMQDKSQRPYFKQASRLPANQFWHSNIDLNIEQGRIEKPLKPTLRVATQLIYKNRFKGILIANLLFEDTINKLTYSDSFHVYLSDKDGEIIHDPESSGSWSKYLKNKKNIHSLFPANAKNILHNNRFRTQAFYAYTMGDLFRNQENLKIIFRPKSGVISEMQDQNFLSALLIAFTVLLVSIPLSWLVSIIPSNLQSKLVTALEKSRKSSDIIDKYVMISNTDENGIIQNISTYFTKVTGYLPDEVIGKGHSILKHPDTPLETHKDLWQTIQKGNVWEGELKDINKNGYVFWVHLVISPEFDEENRITGFTAIGRDITDQKTIEHLSITDSLTGLYNRRNLEKTLSCEMSRFDRHKINFSIVSIDIDFFKKINDTYGHPAGDIVLIQLADILKDNTRKTDYVIRLGGEEFLIIAGGLELEQAFVFAEKLRLIIAEHSFPLVGQVTISCGVAQYNSGENFSELISRADKALYKGKNSGRNVVVKS